MGEADLRADELESVSACVAGRFSRVNLRWQMGAYVRGLLAPVKRKIFGYLTPAETKERHQHTHAA
ncbi:hypothetical protein ACPCUF_35305 [Streptomyces griseoincarnatus]